MSARAIFSISRGSLVNSRHNVARAANIAPITVSRVACPTISSWIRASNLPRHLADLQSIAAKNTTDAEFDVEQLPLQKLAPDEYGARIL